MPDLKLSKTGKKSKGRTGPFSADRVVVHVEDGLINVKVWSRRIDASAPVDLYFTAADAEKVGELLTEEALDMKL